MDFVTFDFVTLRWFIIGKGYILELYNIIILYNLYYTQGLLLTDMRECLMGQWDDGTFALNYGSCLMSQSQKSQCPFRRP